MASESMASVPLTLPVLPLDDEVVLPGMVVPLDLSDNDVRAAVEAADERAGIAVGQASDLLDDAQDAGAGVGPVDPRHEQHAGLPRSGVGWRRYQG